VIDVFNQIYTDVATAVRTDYPGTFVTGERLNKPSKFPTVMVIEADNYEPPESVDNSLRENLAALMYEITVFSNKTSGKRSECIDILSTIDEVMKHKNGRRIARVEGYFDSEATIYMVTARYRLKTDGINLYTF
jgi:hypothetical protein